MPAAEIAGQARQSSFHPVEGGAVIFNPATKRLFALNEAAAAVWLGLRDGESGDELAAGVARAFGIPEPRAREWVAAALALLEQTVAADPQDADWEADPHPGPAVAIGQDMDGASYRLFGRTLRILADDEAIGRIDTLLGGLRAAIDIAAPPDLVLDIRSAAAGYEIRSSRGAVRKSTSATLVGEVEQLIVQTIVPETPHRLAFHGALLAGSHASVLLAAPSGSGKTTMSAALAHRGWRFHSDEIALFDAGLKWRGLPFPPCVKAENFSRIGNWYPALEALPEHERFGRRVKFLPLEAEHRLCRVSNVVFPRFAAGAGTRIEPIAALAGLSELLSQCIHVSGDFTAADVGRVLLWHGGARYWRLTFGDAADAADRLVAEERSWKLT